jgi:hypothetical protein
MGLQGYSNTYMIPKKTCYDGLGSVENGVHSPCNENIILLLSPRCVANMMVERIALWAANPTGA